MKTLRQSLKSLAVCALVACGFAAGAWADEWASNWTFADGKLTETDAEGTPVEGGWVFNASGSASSISLGTVVTAGTKGQLDFSSQAITYVGQNAAKGQTGITALKFPSCLGRIDHWAFQNCTSLVSVDFGEESELYELCSAVFSGCSSLTTVTPLLPEGLRALNNAFPGCPLEGDLRLGYGASSSFTIAQSCFDGCHRLTSIDLGPKVTGMGHWAFRSTDNTTLTSVKMTDSMTSIGSAAFGGCTAITSFEPLLPINCICDQPYLNGLSGLTGTLKICMGDASFGVTAMYFASGTQFDTIVFGTNFNGQCSNHWQFNGVPLKYVNFLGNTVFAPRGAYVFNGAANYQILVTVPADSPNWAVVMADPEQVTPWSSCTPEQQAAFQANFPDAARNPKGLICTYWGSGERGAGSTLINQWIQFDKEVKGSIVVVGDPLEIGEPSPAYGASSFSSTDLTCTAPEFTGDGENLWQCTGYSVSYEEDGVWSEPVDGTGCTFQYGKDSVMPVRLTWHFEKVAYRAKLVMGETVPGTVTELTTPDLHGYYTVGQTVRYEAVGEAFVRWCGDVDPNHVFVRTIEVTIDGAKHVSPYFKADWQVSDDGKSMSDGYWTLRVDGGNITGNIGESAMILDLAKPISDGRSITYIGMSVFKDSPWLEEVELPASLTKLDHYVFQNSKRLRSVDFGEESELFELGSAVFSGCSALTTVTPLLPEGLRALNNAFPGCPLEGDLRLGYGASSSFTIAQSCFDGCHRLTSIDLGPKVTGMGHWAFRSTDNTTLTSVKMTDSVTSIGSGAFGGCTAITSFEPLLPINCYCDQPYLNGLSGLMGTLKICMGDASFGVTAQSFASGTQFDTLVFGPNFNGQFSAHWLFNGAPLKYINFLGDTIPAPRGSAVFNGAANYQILVTVPNETTNWEAVLSDPEQVTPWSNCTDDQKAAYRANFPGEGRPAGLICTRWGSTEGAAGSSFINQWIRREPKSGMKLLLR